MPIGKTPSNILGVSALMRIRKFLSVKNKPCHFWVLMFGDFDLEVVNVIAVTKTQPRCKSVRLGNVSDGLQIAVVRGECEGLLRTVRTNGFNGHVTGYQWLVLSRANAPAGLQ